MPQRLAVTGDGGRDGERAEQGAGPAPPHRLAVTRSGRRHRGQLVVAAGIELGQSADDQGHLLLGMPDMAYLASYGPLQSRCAASPAAAAHPVRSGWAAFGARRTLLPRFLTVSGASGVGHEEAERESRPESSARDHLGPALEQPPRAVLHLRDYKMKYLLIPC